MLIQRACTKEAQDRRAGSRCPDLCTGSGSQQGDRALGNPSRCTQKLKAELDHGASLKQLYWKHEHKSLLTTRTQLQRETNGSWSVFRSKGNQWAD